MRETKPTRIVTVGLVALMLTVSVGAVGMGAMAVQDTTTTTTNETTAGTNETTVVAEGTSPGLNETTTAGANETTTAGANETTTAAANETTTAAANETTTAAANETTTAAANETTVAGEAGKAQVRVAHMSPDAPPVDVLVDGETVVSNLSYGNVTDYAALSAGEHNVTITAAGDPSTVVFSENVTFEADTNYTAVAQGEISENANRPFEVNILEDDFTAPGAGNASVRLVHVSPDAPPVDVTVAGSNTTLFDNVSYGNATAYEEVPAGDYTLEVRPATANDDGEVVGTFNVTLNESTAYSAFAAGYINPAAAPESGQNNPFELILVEDFVFEQVTKTTAAETAAKETTAAKATATTAKKTTAKKAPKETTAKETTAKKAPPKETTVNRTTAKETEITANKTTAQKETTVSETTVAGTETTVTETTAAKETTRQQTTVKATATAKPTKAVETTAKATTVKETTAKEHTPRKTPAKKTTAGETTTDDHKKSSSDDSS
ncbi:DUF4397 domain-containing protein [Haladaptatus caseinilyticus]|uniref:DUF4397 domain-containing protein n=1 Tax=Haladaptatus caseinilyticus TaxID=2993314 RepID=UPI00224B09BA|nr:DUF4397 domain-containing protein [Haladaptatus caseinilyticus]